MKNTRCPCEHSNQLLNPKKETDTEDLLTPAVTQPCITAMIPCRVTTRKLRWSFCYHLWSSGEDSVQRFFKCFEYA